MRPAALLSISLLLLATACSESSGPSGPRPARGVVVLNASQAQGLTLAEADGGSSSFLAFEYPDYDGGEMTLARDTVLTTSSKDGGDQLFVADLRRGSVLRLQLPAGSNPASATFDRRTAAGTPVFLVALRDSSAIASVRPGAVGSAPVVELLRDAGLCPVAAATRGSDVWSLDANAACRTTYAVQGAARLIRVAGAARDTIVLNQSARGSGGSIVVAGDTAWVATSGEADFSRFPNTQFTTPGRVTKVNLATGAVIDSHGLPVGTYGGGMKRGADGRFYLTAYLRTDFSKQGVYVLDPGSLDFVGSSSGENGSFDLRKAAGNAPASCAAATADAQGNIYCVEVDYGSAGASTVYVFGPDGAERRHFAVGQYAADIDIR